ncbi:MAG: hypothetical protein JRN52_04045 [Nitrososphaerota archaeon]|nr:hypothetical protein [Nitrososphaerota archaeon]
MRRSVVDAYKAVCNMRSVDEIDVEWIKRMLNRLKKEKRVEWFGWLLTV